MGERPNMHTRNQPLVSKKGEGTKMSTEERLQGTFLLKYQHWYLTFLQCSEKTIFSFSSS